MNGSDIPTLRERIAELAEALGSKAPGEAGLRAWLAALKDFPMPEVVDAFDHWLRTKPKMPAPSDIRLILAGRLSDRIERQAAADKGDFVQGSKRILTAAQKAIGQEHLAKIRAILSNQGTHDPDDWWHRLIERQRAGEELAYMQLVNSRLAWEKAGRPPDWTPPDIEAKLERAAIQAESEGR
jgi:hypothetical protein